MVCCRFRRHDDKIVASEQGDAGEGKFNCEFKLEAVRLVTERGVSVAQGYRDLDVGESILPRWMRELAEAPASSFPDHGQMPSEQAGGDRRAQEGGYPAQR